MGRCDIGAYEAQALDASDKSVNQLTSVPGQPVRYTINVGNAGVGDIAGISVADTLPAGLNYVNGSLTATGGSAFYQTGVISWTGSVNAGGTVSIQFNASTLPNASMGTVITNTAIISGDGEVFSRRAVMTLAPAKLYLPLLYEPLPGIQGYVTVNGSPASGVFLELRHFDGQSYSTQASLNTDGSGFYDFQAPSLTPGQFYYVRYLNTGGTPGYLWFWGTANINSYSAGAPIGAGNFDLADVPLVSPPDHATVALPSLFQWTRRPASLTDNYQLALFDPNSNAFGQTGLLGYVNGVTLTGVPGSFQTGHAYVWEVLINSPDGGRGTSYGARFVTFSHFSADSQAAVEGGSEQANATPPVDRPRP